MNRVSTHLLDAARGKPAAGVPVRLERLEPSGLWLQLGSAQTDEDGRCSQLLNDDSQLPAGHYRLALNTASYYARIGTEGLYPVVEITFEVRKGESHFHIPLLLSPNSYTTYRGT